MAETNELPDAPAVAREIFTGEAWTKAQAYAELLAGPGWCAACWGRARCRGSGTGTC